MSFWTEELLRLFGGAMFQLALAMHLFACPTFKRRRHFWLCSVLFALAAMAVFEVSLRLFPAGVLPDVPFLDRALLLIPMAWFYLMLLCCYECTPREALYSATCAMALQNGLFNIFWIIMRASGFGEYSPAALAVSWALMVLLYGTALLVFRKWMLDREGHTLPRYRVIQNAVIILLVVIFFNRRADGSAYENYVYAAYFIADVLALLLQISLLHETDLALKNEIIAQLLTSEQKKQQMTTENIELINRKCHDLRHQIKALRHISSEDERNAYIRQVGDAVLFFESAVKTGNQTLDLILMEKQLYCKEHGITLTCVCDGAELDWMDAADLYALFGNALENAIESVREEAPENRVISFRSGQRAGFLSLHFENYLGHDLAMRDGMPLTTKDDQQYHGFGMLSIRHIVEKYGGTMSIRTDRNLFRLDILLPCPREEQSSE